MLTLSDVSAPLTRSVGTITARSDVFRPTIARSTDEIQISFFDLFIMHVLYSFPTTKRHNENEIQVDASFKRIVNGINTRQIAIPSRGRNLSKRKSFSYFLKKKKKEENKKN